MNQDWNVGGKSQAEMFRCWSSVEQATYQREVLTLPEDTVLGSLDGTHLLVHCQCPAASHLPRASITHSTAEGPDDFKSDRIRSNFLHKPRPFRFRLFIPVRPRRGGGLWSLGRSGSQTTELPSSGSCPVSSDEVLLGQPLGVHSGEGETVVGIGFDRRAAKTRQAEKSSTTLGIELVTK